MGYRLPLDSLPWTSANDYPYIFPPDPTQPLPPLATHAQIRFQLGAAKSVDGETARPSGGAENRGPSERAPAKHESAPWISRTAICAEARNGVLYIFMPPTATLEDYLELVAAVEATAEAMRQPILFEGYEPPRDPRLTQFPHHPRPGRDRSQYSSFVELGTSSASTRLFFTKRRALSRLSTEKFMIDGRHTGTGGGNHFALGGATPADSPWLRRPDLLRSFLSYWHNHPSLSYLFSGLFIGPTSQAPRIDEARNDSVRRNRSGVPRDWSGA